MNNNKQFIDIKWLAVYGLTRENVLAYFYTSDFYDPSSNNEVIRKQGVTLDKLTSMVGFEYVLDHEYTKEPHLFVINKMYRKSPRESELCEVFYCIDGIIYQSPCLLDLLRVRIAQVSLNMFSCFEELQSRIRYNSSNEHTLSLEKRKRVKRNEQEMLSMMEVDEQGRDDSGIDDFKRPGDEDNQKIPNTSSSSSGGSSNSSSSGGGGSSSSSGGGGSSSHIADPVAVTVSSKSLPNFNNLLDSIRSDRFTQRGAI